MGIVEGVPQEPIVSRGQSILSIDKQRNRRQEAKELDERQFSQRVRACEQKLYNTARMLLPCQADCEDAEQEALFKAWARLDSLRDTGRFEAWLMRILIDECKMLLRRRRAHRESALTGAEEDFRVPDAPPGAEEMRAALRALEEKYRLPLLLHLAEGFEVVEVARMLRLSQEAVKWRIHKGRQLLRAALEQEVRI